MAIITMSQSLLVGRQTIGQRRFDVNEMSGETGDSADRLMAPPRWLMSMESPSKIDAASMDVWRAMLIQLRGKVNHLAAWDVNRPAPRGTCRGTMTLSGAHAKGATTLVIAVTGQNGLTLVPGDWLQIGSGLTGQLVMVVVGGTANTATITVTVEAPIRINGGYAGGTAVTWDKALGHYKMTSDSIQWVADGGLLMSGAGIDLMEQW